MGGQGLDIRFFRLRAQRSDRLPGPQIGHGNGPGRAALPRRLAPSVRDASEFVQFRPASARLPLVPSSIGGPIGGKCKIWAKCWSEWQDLRFRPLLIDSA
jgi:hypothetical protein